VVNRQLEQLAKKHPDVKSHIGMYATQKEAEEAIRNSQTVGQQFRDYLDRVAKQKVVR
jgi:hypothetical protein